jgi:hypothetical protein
MTEEPQTPRNEIVREERSLGAALLQTAELIGTGAVGGAAAGVAEAVTSHWLDKPDEPPPPTVELPPGVNLDD